MQASIFWSTMVYWSGLHGKHSFPGWMDVWTANGLTTALTGRGKHTLLGNSKGVAGEINPWLKNSPFKTHSEELQLSIKLVWLVNYCCMFSQSNLQMFMFSLGKSYRKAVELWVRLVWIKLILFSLYYQQIDLLQQQQQTGRFDCGEKKKVIHFPRGICFI